MKKEFDIVALGELLIDFTDAGTSPAGQKLFEQNPGGAPANVLCIASRLGKKAAFIGKVGADMQGRFLKGVLEEEGIGTQGLVMAEDAATTLAFVNIAANGEREFSFHRKPGADTCLEEKELCKELLADCRIFHFGSVSLTDEPARSATLAAVRMAKENGALISYDPNYRAPLWKDEETAKAVMLLPIPEADVLKVSEEEAVFLTGRETLEEALQALLDMGVKYVIATLGAEGAVYAFGEARGSVPSFKVENAVDTTGAGDAFWGAFLSSISGNDPAADLEKNMLFASAAAALCVSRRGAIPAMPAADEVLGLLNAKKPG